MAHGSARAADIGSTDGPGASAHLISPQTKWLSMGILALFAVSGSAPAAGQQTRKKDEAMVSVAALRVPLKARQHLEKARLAAIAGHDAECDLELTAALAIDPDFGEAYILRASRKIILKQYEAGIENALAAQRVEPGIPWATIIHAEACNGLRRFNEAFTLLDSLRSTEIGTWQAKYEMTRAVLGLGEAVAALQWSKLTLEAVPEAAMPNAILLRANAFQMARRWPEAMEQLDKYLALPGTQPARTQVLAVRERVQKIAQQEQLATVAPQ